MAIKKGNSQPSVLAYYSVKEQQKSKENELPKEMPKKAMKSDSWWSAPKEIGAKPGKPVDFGSGRRQLKRAHTSYETPQQVKKAAPAGSRPSWHSKVEAAGSHNQKVELSSEQLHVLNVVKEGQSLFYTGAAGTGKSFLLKKIISDLRSYTHNSQHIAICATTGLASKNIGGQTIHSWSGIGRLEGTAFAAHQKLTKPGPNAKYLLNWRNVKVLVIDEVSMLSKESFELLENIARLTRQNERVFGGIQVILVGDFFQLPPVEKQRAPKFCFESPIWKKLIGKNQLILHKVFRQKHTDKLTGMLNEIRLGKMSPQTIALFKDLERDVVYQDGLEPTRIYPLREQVADANEKRIQLLPGRSVIFEAIDVEMTQYNYGAAHFKEHMSQKKLELKIGAQVLMILNRTEKNLVNGSRGKVIAFIGETMYYLVQKLFPKYGRDEVMNLYNLVFENEGSNEAIKEKMDAVISDPVDQALILDAATSKLEERVPLIDFLLPEWVLIPRETFEKYQAPPKHKELVATRSQVPLILSYALSIHKAQGQTIDRLVVDLNKIFLPGQAYVAVSRATSFDRLQVTGFHEKKVTSHERVITFYNNLSTI